MRKVFEVELSSQGGSWAELTLPAEPYVLLDALEKLRLEPGEAPRWELFGADDDIFQHLDQDNGSLPELNALAQRFAQLDGAEITAFEGLAAMERMPVGQPVPLPRLIDLAYSTDCCHLVEGVVTDAQLGRFCAENGFVPETKGLSDAAFELLDFERIGRQFREAEGGVFTRGGYVQRREKLKQVYGTLDLTPRKPDYAMLAELPLRWSPQKPRWCGKYLIWRIGLVTEGGAFPPSSLRRASKMNGQGSISTTPPSRTSSGTLCMWASSAAARPGLRSSRSFRL